MSDIPREFDAMFRTENAQIYGVSFATFQQLTQACIAAHRYGDIVAHTIEPVPDGRDHGCNVLLAGKNFGFELHVDDTDKNCPFVALWAQRLDTNDENLSLFDDDAGDHGEWAFNRVVNIMIRLDGLRASWRKLTFDQTHELLYREGFFGR